MNHETSWQNERWAELIIDQLTQCGLVYFCLSPGSRSTPLLHAAAKHPAAQTMVHFDERGMAFHALGYAKASNLPAALIVTSGTAVANLLPAIMEASASNIPLIILTADRPPELRDTGANQTTDQVKIFAAHVRWQVDLPCPELHLPDAFVSTTIAGAVYRSRNGHPGPVHINVSLREPFFYEGAPLQKKTFSFPTSYARTLSVPDDAVVEEWASQISSFDKGVILVGALPIGISKMAIYALAERLHWPVLPDILSGGRSDGMHKNAIAYYDYILKTQTDLRPEVILHFGDRLVSKALLEWTGSSSPFFYGLVADHPCRHDPNHSVTHRVQGAPEIFCKNLLASLPQKNKTAWLAEWQGYSSGISNQLEAFFSEQSSLTEPALAHWLSSETGLQDYALFFSNSMPIRDADNFFFSNKPTGLLFGNRGLSGIDGNIATAIGIAQGTRRPTLAILGDLAFLHDINSLAQLKNTSFPVILIVINNDGGGIFSFLPVAKKTKAEFFERYIATPHALHFESAAHLFNVPYQLLTSCENWKDILGSVIQEKKSCIVEIKTDRVENYELHLQILEYLQTCSPIR